MMVLYHVGSGPSLSRSPLVTGGPWFRQKYPARITPLKTSITSPFTQLEALES